MARFKAILAERRAQINAKQPLPNLPGQALYLARLGIMSTYKDLTDAMPSKIGRPNKFGIPPQYFDAANEPLIDEYLKLFDVMQAAPANAQNSATPFKDVVDLASALRAPRASMRRPPTWRAASASGCSLPRPTATRTSATRAPTNTRAVSRPATSKDLNGRRKWAAIKTTIAQSIPQLRARDDKEEARLGNVDRRFNHWTAVRRRPDERPCGIVPAAFRRS